LIYSFRWTGIVSDYYNNSSHDAIHYIIQFDRIVQQEVIYHDYYLFIYKNITQLILTKSSLFIVV